MTKVEKSLARMRTNPRDWSIQEILALAERYGLRVRQPAGSHVIISFPDGDISIPAHRPIKPVYVKRFIELLDAMLEES